MRSLTNYPVGGSGGNVILRNQSLNFTNLTAVINDSRVTESTLILVYYSEATEAAAQSAGITSETNNGNITFTAANTPSTTIVCDIVLLSEGSGGGGGGTSDYTDLSNKPSINGVELSGNKTASQLGMANANTFQGTIAEWNALTTAEKKAYDHASIPDSIDGGVTFPANKVIMTGGGNVENAVGEVASGLTNAGTYSTTPVKIGNWLGHDIYRKVVSLGALPNTTLLDVASGLTNEIIVNIYGIAFETNSTYTLPLPFISATQGDLIEIGYNNASHAIRVTSTMDVSSFNGYAVLEYYTAG